eukprot:TRINITY_DN72785_c0_g1_i1.p1 TRINITY_DN72785_c0_g1~~TRINITY_DN72785_c0_g1_i1.p1  ORF type:complete len:281 (+),score=75.27 TRINITY_DN72785_c0_g1_i1:192-1034(+)
MTSQVHGIEAYVKRLEAIAAACGEKPQTKEAVQKDEFLRLKKRCYELLEEVRDNIKDRQSLIKKRGNCYESIQKGNLIRNQLDELKGTLPKLQELHKKAQGRWFKNKRQDEIQERYQVLRLLKRLVDEANELFLTGNASTQGVDTTPDGSCGGPTASLLGLRHTAAEEDRSRNLSDEERGVLDRLKARDLDIDRQVGEVGAVVDRLGDMAGQLGAAAERQRLKAEAVAHEVTKAEADVVVLNKKVAEVIKYEKNTNFCCQMILAIALLCCLGFILQQLKL